MMTLQTSLSADVFGRPTPTPREARRWICDLPTTSPERGLDVIADRIEGARYSLHADIENDPDEIATRLREAAPDADTSALRDAILLLCEHRCLEARDAALFRPDIATRALDDARTMVLLLAELQGQAATLRAWRSRDDRGPIDEAHDLLETAYALGGPLFAG